MYDVEAFKDFMSLIKLHVAGMNNTTKAEIVQARLMGKKGITQVDVNLQKEVIRVVSSEDLSESQVHDLLNPGADNMVCGVALEKPSPKKIAGALLVVLAIGYVLQRFGWLSPNVAIGTGIGFGAAFLMGLVAASSSCVAVSGGLMLSALSTFHRTRSVGMFIAGRIISYALLGGLIGAVGKAFVPSSALLALITIAAALYMLVTGLNMLGIAPAWMRRLAPSVPRSITNTILDAGEKKGTIMPFLLGAATFFLPCGFTQSLQLYALTTGSPWTSGLILLAFALGTAPALIALGLASTKLSGKAGQTFYHYAGALVVVLGLFNIQNGLTIAGVSLPSVSFEPSETVTRGADVDPNIVDDGTTQRINISLINRAPYYAPSDEFTVKVGEPVELQVRGDAGGCRSIFQIPEVDVRLPIVDAVNTVTFTPDEPGDLVFSCSMGMYRGTIHVVES